MSYCAACQSLKLKSELHHIDTSYTNIIVHKDSCGNSVIYLKYQISKQYEYIKLTKISVIVESKTDRIEELYYFKDDKLIYMCLIEYRFDILFSDLVIYYKNNKMKYYLDGSVFKISNNNKINIEEKILQDIKYYKNI